MDWGAYWGFILIMDVWLNAGLRLLVWGDGLFVSLKLSICLVRELAISVADLIPSPICSVPACINSLATSNKLKTSPNGRPGKALMAFWIFSKYCLVDCLLFTCFALSGRALFCVFCWGWGWFCVGLAIILSH